MKNAATVRVQSPAVVASAIPVGVVAGCTGERIGMMQEGTTRQKAVGRKLAEMASDDQIAYTPTGRVDKVGHIVWHEMFADDGGKRYTYWLRRDWGSVAGGFSNEDLEQMEDEERHEQEEANKQRLHDEMIAQDPDPFFGPI